MHGLERRTVTPLTQCRLISVDLLSRRATSTFQQAAFADKLLVQAACSRRQGQDADINKSTELAAIRQRRHLSTVDFIHILLIT